MKHQTTGQISRRTFVQQAGMAAGGLALWPKWRETGRSGAAPDDLKVHLFTKHVQFLDYQEMAEAVYAAGFDGVDLTVRSGGHVETARVSQDLPKAVKAIRQAGLDSIVMTTNVNDPHDQTDRRVLEVAADQGITHYRMEYFRYLDGKTIPESISHYRKQLAELSELNAHLGIVGNYQNHAGTRMGSSIWELYDMLRDCNDYLGAQYDIRHATVEGGLNWSKGLELIQPRIRSFVIKDFVWKEANGKWRPENVPFAEGMVEWMNYFKQLKSYKINVPVSLHMEYPLGGAEHGRREISVSPQVVFDAMKKDLDLVRKMWSEA